MHIAFHLAIDRIFSAVFTSTVPSTGAGDRTARRERRVPTLRGWLGFHFCAPDSRTIADQQRLFALPVNFTSAINVPGASAWTLPPRLSPEKTIDTFGQRRAGKCCAQYHRSNRQITVHHLLRVKTSQQRSESCFGMQSARSGSS